MTNRHFGRISEVWKHLVLAEVLANERPSALFDTHAGDAIYPVVDDAERSYGVLGFSHLVDDHAVLGRSAYGAVLAGLRRGSTLEGIPGGPLVAMSVLGNTAHYVFCDLDGDSIDTIDEVATARDVGRVEVRRADGMASVAAALEAGDPAGSVVFIDPFDHRAVGPTGLSALELGFRVARAGAVLVYWYGYNSIERRQWLLDVLTENSTASSWWCGDIMVSQDGADLRSGDLGVSSSPGTGSGLVCANASTATIQRCTELGEALAAAYRRRPLPTGGTGDLTFASSHRQ